MTVANLNDDEIFKELKNSELYSFFRQGPGKNLAAASDVARYPIMNKHGGIYLDTDDLIQANVGNATVMAGANDFLLNKPVVHYDNDYKTFYNTSNFATQPGNPVISDMITEMKQRFSKNKPYFAANRPIATRRQIDIIILYSLFCSISGILTYKMDNIFQKTTVTVNIAYNTPTIT